MLPQRTRGKTSHRISEASQKSTDSMRKKNLSKQLINQIVEKILEEVKPEKIVVFGSSVRNDNTNSSDIDIALFGVKDEKIFLLKDKLNEELPTLKDVDIVLFDTLKNESSLKLKKRILDEGVVIYERSPKR